MPKKMTDNMRKFLTRLADLMEEHKVDIEADVDSRDGFQSMDFQERNSTDFYELYYNFFNEITIRKALEKEAP